MGAPYERPAAARLLCECAAGCDGRGLARFVRNLFRNNGRTGVRVAGCRRHVGAHRSGSAGRALGRSSDAAVIRVYLPSHLRTLARIVSEEVILDVDGPVTQRTVLNALEARYPMLRGTVRDQVT